MPVLNHLQFFARVAIIIDEIINKYLRLLGLDSDFETSYKLVLQLAKFWPHYLFVPGGTIWKEEQSTLWQ
jgi:hypothetical protein